MNLLSVLKQKMHIGGQYLKVNIIKASNIRFVWYYYEILSILVKSLKRLLPTLHKLPMCYLSFALEVLFIDLFSTIAMLTCFLNEKHKIVFQEVK